MIQLPRMLEAEIDALVSQGMYTTRDEAAVDLIRRGLESLKPQRGPPRPGPLPERPPPPPGVGNPGDDDRPISVDPRDSRWLE